MHQKYEKFFLKIFVLCVVFFPFLLSCSEDLSTSEEKVESNIEENQEKEEKNLETTLLIDPINEEAILMSMKIALKKSNYKKVKKLSKTFSKVCETLCKENKSILENLDNIEPKNDS